jgi:hypothetical protein
VWIASGDIAYRKYILVTWKAQVLVDYYEA